MATTTLSSDAPAENVIRWGLILRSSVIGALVGVIVILVLMFVLQQNPSTVLETVCPPTLGHVEPAPGSGIGGAIGAAIVSVILWVALCSLILTVYGLVIYFPVAIILALVLVGSQVVYRRVLHIVLTVVISIPIAFVLLWGMARLLNALGI